MLDFVEFQRKKPVIGFGCVLGEDEIFQCPRGALPLRRLSNDLRRPVVEGDLVRDWCLSWESEVLFPYTPRIELRSDRAILDYFWSMRTLLGARNDFGKQTYRECGRPFWEYHQIPVERNQAKLLITFGEITTHNHFVLDHGGKVFNRTAPIIKLKPGATESDHVHLLGVLNSSTACFWLRQVCFPKGGDHQGSEGARVRTTLWDERFAFNGTQIANLPIPARLPSQLPTALVNTSRTLQDHSPKATLAVSGEALRERLDVARNLTARYRSQLIAWQEELDWQIYEAFGLISPTDGVSLPEGTADTGSPPGGIQLGERAFEIVMARRVAAGKLQTNWFERHGSTPITEVPKHWPAAYRELVQRRIQRITDDPKIRLIEQPEYKRRWNTEPWEEQLEKALEKWLLDRIERVIGRDLNAPDGSESVQAYQPKVELLTTQEITDLVLQPDFRDAAEVYRDRADFDPHKLVAELIESAAVPFLPGQRYKETGLRKRSVWEDTWDKQRAEDALDEQVGLNARNLTDEQRKLLEAEAKKLKAERIGEIPVPPKYASTDFRSSTFWSLRKGLDVPKERFISYPGCSRDGDPCLTVVWAGLDFLQQAKALAAHYGNLQETGAGQPKLLLVLAGLNELLPWLKQWHNQLDPEFGLKMGDYYEEYVREEAKRFGKSLTDLKQLAMTTT